MMMIDWRQECESLVEALKYARGRIVELETRLDTETKAAAATLAATLRACEELQAENDMFREAVMRVAKADHDYGLGFYSDDAWITEYLRLARIAGLPDGWRTDWPARLPE